MLWGAVLSAAEEARTIWQDGSGIAAPLSDCTRPGFLEAVGEGRCCPSTAGSSWHFTSARPSPDGPCGGPPSYTEYVSALAQERTPAFLAGAEAGAALPCDAVVELAIAQTVP